MGKFKEDVKDLKSAWAKNLNIEDMMSFASPEEIIAYQNRKVELENEVQRRIRIVLKLLRELIHTQWYIPVVDTMTFVLAHAIFKLEKTWQIIRFNLLRTHKQNHGQRKIGK